MFRPVVAAAVIALVGAACAGRPDIDADASPAAADSVYVEVFNDYFYDARVHAVFAGGRRRSLGTIRGNGGQGRSTIVWEPRSLVFEVSFIIDGSAYVSQPLDVARNESIEVRLPANIGQSGFFRRVSSDAP